MKMENSKPEKYLDDQELFLAWVLARSKSGEVRFLRHTTTLTTMIPYYKYLTTSTWAGVPNNSVDISYVVSGNHEIKHLYPKEYLSYNSKEPYERHVLEDIVIKINKRNQESLVKKIKQYLLDFEKGAIVYSGENIWNFITHQKMIDSAISRMFHKYGHTFKVELHELVGSQMGSLPLHYILWLESQNKIEIVNLEYTIKNVPSEDPTLEYEQRKVFIAHIQLQPIFIEHLHYLEEHPEVEMVRSQKKPPVYDSSKKIVNLEGQSIAITNRAETQETKLLEIIFSSENWESFTFDGIRSNWKEGEPPNDNTIYQTVGRINKKFGLVLKGEEFLNSVGKRVRINPTLF